MKKDLKKLNVRLFHDYIITTMDANKVSPSGIVLSSKEQGVVKSRQTVLAAGPNAMVSPGDEVELNVSRFPTKPKDPDKYEKNGIGPSHMEVILPVETIEGTDYLFITSREIKYVYLDPTSVVAMEAPKYITDHTAVKPC